MYRHMEEMEIEIGRLSNLKMVHFYNLISHDDEVGAIAVYDDEERQINLCALDKYYDTLLAKVVECYREQKDRVQIVMDEETKTMLDSMVQEAPTSERPTFWGDIPGATLQALPEIDPGSYSDCAVLPLLRYFLRELHRLYNVPLVWKYLTPSWHGRGVLEAVADERNLHMPYRIQTRKDGEYDVVIGNFLGKTHRLNLRFLYEKMGMKVFFSCKPLGLDGYSSYTLSLADKTVAEKTGISVSGKVVFEHTETLKPLAPSEKETLKKKATQDGLTPLLVSDWECAEVVEYPWGQYLICSVVASNDENMKKQDVEIGYLMLDDRYDIIRKHTYSHLVGQKSNVEMDARYARGDIFVLKDRKGRVQIAFEDTGYCSSGSYKERFSGRYLIGELPWHCLD
ncbi:MAG: hypothetical protein J5757_06965 [Lachnospiraceae bacterium]|nr:hypothetical protein [Lachnospiraceae bacterium]